VTPPWRSWASWLGIRHRKTTGQTGRKSACTISPLSGLEGPWIPVTRALEIVLADLRLPCSSEPPLSYACRDPCLGLYQGQLLVQEGATSGPRCPPVPMLSRSMSDQDPEGGEGEPLAAEMNGAQEEKASPSVLRVQVGRRCA
jgi:hypothetical protein